MLRHLGGQLADIPIDILGVGRSAPGTPTQTLAFSENRLLGRAQEDRHSLRTGENHVVGCYELHEATFHPSDSEIGSIDVGLRSTFNMLPTFR